MQNYKIRGEDPTDYKTKMEQQQQQQQKSGIPLSFRRSSEIVGKRTNFTFFLTFSSSMPKIGGKRMTMMNLQNEIFNFSFHSYLQLINVFR